MYHSDLIIKGIQADKLMALQLEKALAGVKDLALTQAGKIGDGATRLLYYTSCFTDNYQDVCARLKEEDIRFHKDDQIVMLKFLKKWLRYEISFFFWSYVPLGVIILFGMFAVTYFREYAMQSIGVFTLLTFAFVIWFNSRR